MILAESPFFDVPLIVFLRNIKTHQEFPKKNHLPNKNRYFSRLSPNQSMHQTPEDQQKLFCQIQCLQDVFFNNRNSPKQTTIATHRCFPNENRCLLRNQVILTNSKLCGAPNEWAERQTRFPLHLGHVRGKSEGDIFFWYSAMRS